MHDPIKEKQRKLPKNWEVTAATPPLIIHDATKVLSINESLRLQTEQTKKLQVFNFFMFPKVVKFQKIFYKPFSISLQLILNIYFTI